MPDFRGRGLRCARLVPEVSAAIAVSAYELIPDEEGEEPEIVFADVATVGRVSNAVVSALSLVDHQTLQKRTKFRVILFRLLDN
jgi:hypothetical protein